jgi:hypothetical protein
VGTLRRSGLRYGLTRESRYDPLPADFYTFTAPQGRSTSSVVTRYRPSDGTIVQVASTPGLTIMGAGVSTCAPE